MQAGLPAQAGSLRRPPRSRRLSAIAGDGMAQLRGRGGAADILLACNILRSRRMNVGRRDAHNHARTQKGDALQSDARLGGQRNRGCDRWHAGPGAAALNWSAGG